MQFTNAQKSALRYDKNIIVEAGAGSGKTAVFVQRYLNILSENPTILPEHILAITFTNKAAYECMERIRKHILSHKDDVGLWLDHLSRAHISTIHGFCSYLIKQYCLNLNLPSHFSILDEQDRTYFFKMAINDTFRQLADESNTDFKHYITQFSILRLQQDLELVFQQKNNFQSYIASIQFIQNKSESDNYLLSLNRIFERVIDSFTAIKKRLNLLDYDDLLTHFDTLLDNDLVRKRLQEQFKFIMIDECQDVDPKQWESIQRLVTDLNPLAGQKLFLVGDAKQSIYGFRGADLRFFSLLSNSFAQHPTTCSTVYLNDNFRTCSAILNFLNPLFDDLFQTGGSHNIDYNPLVPFRDTTGSVHCLLLKDAAASADEARALYYWISDYLASNPSYSYSDIAILCRQRKQCYKLKSALESFGLPIHLDREPGFFQEQVVIDLFELIKALCLPNDSLAWITVLQSPIFGFNSNLVHLLFSKTTSTRFLGKLNEGLAFTDTHLQSLNLSTAETLIFKKGLQLLKQFLTYRHDADMATILKQILTESGAYSIYYTLNSSNQLYIEQFLDIIDQLESQKFMSRFELIERLEYKLKTTQTALNYTDTEQQSIQIMTIHSSKGLEFPIVICPELHTPFSVKKASPLLITNTAVHLSVGDSSSDQDRIDLINDLTVQNIEEEKRLFYVACTRARDTLVLSGLTDSKHYKKTCYLSFLYQLYEANDDFSGLQNKKSNSAINATLISQLSNLAVTDKAQQSPTTATQQVHSSLLQLPDLKDDNFDFTSLSTLEHRSHTQQASFDTLKEQHKNAIMVDKSAQFGVITHKLLRDLFETGPWENSFLNTFIEQNKLASICTPSQLDHINIHFNTCLHSDFLMSLRHYNLEFEKEFNIRHQQHIIRGRFDCLAIASDHVYIIDFKTESFKTKHEKDIKEKYHLQTSLYLKAAQQQFKRLNKEIKLIFYSTFDDSYITI